MLPSCFHSVGSEKSVVLSPEESGLSLGAAAFLWFQATSVQKGCPVAKIQGYIRVVYR